MLMFHLPKDGFAGVILPIILIAPKHLQRFLKYYLWHYFQHVLATWRIVSGLVSVVHLRWVIPSMYNSWDDLPNYLTTCEFPPSYSRWFSSFYRVLCSRGHFLGGYTPEIQHRYPKWPDLKGDTCSKASFSVGCIFCHSFFVRKFPCMFNPNVAWFLKHGPLPWLAERPLHKGFALNFPIKYCWWFRNPAPDN